MVDIYPQAHPTSNPNFNNHELAYTKHLIFSKYIPKLKTFYDIYSSFFIHKQTNYLYFLGFPKLVMLVPLVHGGIAVEINEWIQKTIYFVAEYGFLYMTRA